MNKKLLSALSAVMLIPTLAACSGNTDANAATTATTSASESVTDAPITSTEETAASFEEIILADTEHCTFKITSIDADNIWGYTLNVYLENKTEKELMFSLDDVAVNGFMCDPFWASTVAPGMKANEEISFSDSDFEKNGIEDVTDITFTLQVYDANDWTADDLLEETFTINP